MSPDLDAKLCADSPLLYSILHENTRRSLSYFGFEADDGSVSLELIVRAMLATGASSKEIGKVIAGK